MKSMDVEILLIAREDVNQALIYISADNPPAADALLNQFIEKLEQLAEFPYSGVEIIVGKKYPRRYHRLSVRPYNIYYRIMENKAVILRVLHERMDASRML